ncbi:MAG: CPBP family intramembrane metalloprotease [Actinobacteria bacterium]|nr:MAG: CPBP family intramembrane metalloprotease [Actinomycetota bacterium]
MRPIETPFLLDPEACTQCRECAQVCRTGAIEISEGDIYIDAEECDGCEECALACPTTAIQIASDLPGRAGDGGDARRGGLAGEGGDIHRSPSSQAARPGAKAPWTISDVLIGLGVLLTFTIVQRGLQLPMLIQAFSPGSTHVLLTIWALFYYSAMVLTLWAIARRRGAELSDFGVRGFNVPRAVGYSVGALVVLSLFTFAYTLIAGEAGLPTPPKTEVQILRWFGLGPGGFALAVLVAVIIAPLAEEMFFRGFVYAALRERIGITSAIGVSSLIFALYHGNLWLIIPIMFLGMGLAWLYETQHSLGPPLLFHALNNFLGIVLIYLKR